MAVATFSGNPPKLMSLAEAVGDVLGGHRESANVSVQYKELRAKDEVGTLRAYQ
tara:strand:- start:95 stop:256 length:162 start_codon:yes stop_codon:yes gene_type:complete